MLRHTLLAALAAIAVPTFAAPFVVGDLADQSTTHCAIEINGGAWGPDVPTSGTPRQCKFDVASVSVGTNTVRAKAIKIDAGWGRLESAPSAPFVFTRPAVPVAPATLQLAP